MVKSNIQLSHGFSGEYRSFQNRLDIEVYWFRERMKIRLARCREIWDQPTKPDLKTAQTGEDTEQ